MTVSSAALPDNRYTSVLRMLSKIPRPSATAATMLAKLSSARTMSDASRVTSVPVRPMAMPICASRSAGASLTPSPAIATMAARAFHSRTIRILSSGVALSKQIASVRDSAAELLEQLADGATKGSKRHPVATAALDTPKGRSGGVVDAPGKKHRKPMRTDPGANIADRQAAKMRVADRASGALFNQVAS
jgi:hypothetical protein